MIKSTSYRIWIRIILLLLFAIAFSYSNFSELVARSDGLGWDGECYYQMIKNLSNDYFNHGIDKYHMQRILPFAIVHFVFKLFEIEPSVANALAGMRVLNTICIIVMLYFFFKLSNLRKWSVASEAIAFSFVFFTFDIGKLIGYYPVSTSSMAQLLSLLAVYYFFRNDNVKSVIVCILLLFVWPIGSLITLILLIFPRTQVGSGVSDRFSKKINGLIKTAYITWVPGILLLLIVFHFVRHGELSMYYVIRSTAHRMALNTYVGVFGMLSAAVFYYYATRKFSFDWKSIINSIFQRKELAVLTMSFALFAIFYKLSTYYGGPAVFSMKHEILCLLRYPTTDILIWIETHFLSLGLFFILIMVYWNNILNRVSSYGIGYLFVLLMGLIFCMDIETRKLTTFMPIFLVPLMDIINKKKFRIWVLYAITGFQFVFSFFWIHVNVTGIEKAFKAIEYDTLMSFPAQRWFMFSGQYQGHEAYYFFSAILLFIIFIIWMLDRKKMLLEETTDTIVKN